MASDRIKWHVEVWEVSKLKPYNKNPRIITEQGLSDLKASFDEIGFAQYININTDGTVLSGHARLLQIKSEGTKEIEVLVPDRKLTPKQEEAVVIRMNKNIAGKWDFDILANEFDLSDLIEYGFTEKDILIEPLKLEPVEDCGTNEDINFTIVCEDTHQLDELKMMFNLKKTKVSFNEFIKNI